MDVFLTNAILCPNIYPILACYCDPFFLFIIASTKIDFFFFTLQVIFPPELYKKDDIVTFVSKYDINSQQYIYFCKILKRITTPYIFFQNSKLWISSNSLIPQTLLFCCENINQDEYRNVLVCCENINTAWVSHIAQSLGQEFSCWQTNRRY